MEVKCLIPKNMITFSCIGNKCEDTCCGGWQIDIDKETYVKYKKIQNVSLRNQIISNIEVLESSNKDKLRYGRIILRDNKCPILQDGLCLMQNKLGHSYLSYTCRTYPRKFIKIHDLIEITYTLSCPEVVRKLILDDKPMEFNIETINLDKEEQCVKYCESSNFHKYFWDIRSLAIKIMQNRDISINKRMIILGMFLEDISKSTDFQTSIMEYNSVIDNPIEFINELAKVKNDDSNVRMLFNILFDYIKQIVKTKTKPGVEDIKKLLETDYDNIYDEFITIYKTKYVEFEKNIHYIIENIVVYNIYYNKIPLDVINLTIMDRYKIILLHVLVYRMFLVLHYLKYKDFNFKPEYYIQKIYRIFGHDKSFEVMNVNLENNNIDFIHIIMLINYMD